MVSLVELIAAVITIVFMLLLITKGNFEVGVTSVIGRSNPRIQFRCHPSMNARLANHPAKSIRKLEDGRVEIKYRTSAFKTSKYPLKIPKKFIRHIEYPETEHKEGLFIVEEFQPDVRSSDPYWDFYKDLIYNTDHQLSVVEKQLSILKDNIEKGSAPSYVLAQINSLIPVIEKLHDATRDKEKELSAILVETDNRPQKQLAQQPTVQTKRE